MQDQRHDEDNHIQDLSGAEAIQKMKELAEAARTCFFTTLTDSRPLPTRPMAVQTVESDGSFYFFSAASSNKNHQLQQDSTVQLFFANSGSSEYLSVYGKAMISQDRAKIKELWNEFVKVWFQEGPDDPDLTLIQVQPTEARYWDTKHNKMVMWAKMAASMVTGKTMDDGVEGTLRP
jgi:general stress protein 26